MTPTQLRLLSAIQALTCLNGYPPSNRELADLLGYYNKGPSSGVSYELKALQEKGLITGFAVKTCRTLLLTDAGKAAILEEIRAGK
jgi:DNA-binding MarR family transcriptional regulator